MRVLLLGNSALLGVLGFLVSFKYAEEAFFRFLCFDFVFLQFWVEMETLFFVRLLIGELGYNVYKLMREA